MSTLMLRLAAPMQSWGMDGKYDRRGTERAPTKSGVIGLVASALGRRRNEDIGDIAALRFGVRVDREGVLLRDYHTARHETNAKLAYVTRRYYLSDAAFLVGLEGADALLCDIERALEKPAFPLFLGRRSCPPEGRVVLGLRDAPLLDALREEPPLVAGPGANAPTALQIWMDGDAGAGAQYANDLPLSFDPRRREYGFRSVVSATVSINQVRPEPSTEHDPMSELEG